jgi:ABC-type uncharacterized transport system ATPase subunit
MKEDKTPVLIVSLSHAGQVKNISKIALGNNVDITSAAGAGKTTFLMMQYYN